MQSLFPEFQITSILNTHIFQRSDTLGGSGSAPSSEYTRGLYPDPRFQKKLHMRNGRKFSNLP